MLDFLDFALKWAVAPLLAALWHLDRKINSHDLKHMEHRAAIEVVKARGGSLADHVSRKLTLDLVRHADVILAMTGDHLEALLENVPEIAPRTRLLHPDGFDVSDPVGADRETYQRTAAAIETYLSGLLDSLGV